MAVMVCAALHAFAKLLSFAALLALVQCCGDTCDGGSIFIESNDVEYSAAAWSREECQRSCNSKGFKHYQLGRQLGGGNLCVCLSTYCPPRHPTNHLEKICSGLWTKYWSTKSENPLQDPDRQPARLPVAVPTTRWTVPRRPEVTAFGDCTVTMKGFCKSIQCPNTMLCAQKASGSVKCCCPEGFTSVLQNRKMYGCRRPT